MLVSMLPQCILTFSGTGDIVHLPMSNTFTEELRSNPASFLETTIKQFVTSSKNNCLPAFNNDAIFDEPLVGFADGDDPIFQEYKKPGIIGEFHLTPREILEKTIKEEKKPKSISVISFILPITLATRLSLRRETRVVSLRWNHTRWLGQDLINELSQHVVSLLENKGYHAIAPELSPLFERKDQDGIPISNWSQRHVAFAAGLGTFSLSDGFITPRGIAMRCGSVVCDLKIPPTARPYNNHLANCLSFRGKACRRCIDRCPGNAISELGHDKKRCRNYLFEQAEIVKAMGQADQYMGRYLGCGLCQTKVPCEACIPPLQE